MSVATLQSEPVRRAILAGQGDLPLPFNPKNKKSVRLAAQETKEVSVTTEAYGNADETATQSYTLHVIE